MRVAVDTVMIEAMIGQLRQQGLDAGADEVQELLDRYLRAADEVSKVESILTDSLFNLDL